MSPMKILPECRSCLERLVDLTVSLATDNPEVQRRARDTAMDIIAEEFGPTAIPALIANRFHLAIQEITGNPDPFLPRKQTETAYLSSLYHKVASSYDDDLESLLKLAVVGNALDFFREEAEVSREILSRVEFTVSHLKELQQLLQNSPGILLYLADNAGEQFFDQPLVAFLRRQGWQVIYVVKGGPIQNDITPDDLFSSGLAEILEPVADTGARTVGLVLAEASNAFCYLYDEAQIIIAKGMGHFETMSHLADPRLFFLLQAKCAAVAQALGVPRGSFVLSQPTQIFP